MTVAQLIAALQTQSPTAMVLIDHDWTYNTVENVIYHERDNKVILS